MPDTESPISQNLRLLCSHYASISEVCRRLGMNRQQFNKYLNGHSMPSMHSLKRIADFFGVDEAEIHLPHEDFARTVLGRPASWNVPVRLLAFWRGYWHRLGESNQALSRYCGFYHLYYRSPAWRDSIVRSLAAIHQDRELTYVKVIDRLVRKDKPHLGCFVHKMDLVAIHEGARIYLFGYEGAPSGAFSMAILYPSSRSQLRYLHGLGLGVEGAAGRTPVASRILLEHLGKKPDLRAAIRSCGVYSGNGGAIEEEIRSMVDNRVSGSDIALTALQL